MKNHLISVADLSLEQIEQIFQLAQQVKRSPVEYQKMLQGKMFGLIFEKPSTRTWISFETGIFQLGGGTIYLGPGDMKLGIREEVRDVARVLDRYLAGVVLRTFAHETIEEFRKYFTKPVINGLSDFEHPCQAMADYFTIQEKFFGEQEKFSTDFKPLLAFIGDGNNVLNSLILLTAILGGRIHYATPKGNEPNKDLIVRAQGIAKKTGAEIIGGNDPLATAKDADVIYTDVWVSMGEETIRDQKMKAFKGMQINKELLKKAKPDAAIMHCLPAHRGEEITDDVMESPQSIVFDQAENRLHVQKAILLHLLNKGEI